MKIKFLFSGFFIAILLNFVFSQRAFAEETGFRSPTTCVTDGSSCDNMKEQDTLYNSWKSANAEKVIVSFSNFGVPDNAIIDTIEIKLRIRSSVDSVWLTRASKDGTIYAEPGYCYIDNGSCRYLVSSSFNSIDTSNIVWSHLDTIFGQDINSPGFTFLLTESDNLNVKDTDIDTALFNIKYHFDPSVTPTPTPSPPPIPKNKVQDFKQNRNVDGSLVSWGNDMLFNLTNCSSMAAEGCAITSMTDVLASYGLTILPDNSSISPGNFNNYLAQQPGTHSGCAIYFNTASRVVNYTMLHNDFSQTTSLANRIEHIDDALNSGNLVIAGIGGHFIVLYKKATDPASDGSPDYYIADPYRYAPYATGDRSGKLLSEAYHSINQLENVLQVVVLKNQATQSGKSWSIVAHSPVQLLITDPDGKQTGFDASTNLYLENIPGSTYGLQKGLSDDDGILPQQPDVLYYGQENPSDGVYAIQVQGTGTGPYKLDVATAEGPGTSSVQSVEGIAEPGKIDSYLVTSSQNSPAINKTITFQNVIVDVTDLYSQNLITQKSVTDSLIRNIQQAQKASDVGDTNKVIQNLDQFIAILNRDRGKKITEEAYQALLFDANSLKK